MNKNSKKTVQNMISSSCLTSPLVWLYSFRIWTVSNDCENEVEDLTDWVKQMEIDKPIFHTISHIYNLWPIKCHSSLKQNKTKNGPSIWNFPHAFFFVSISLFEFFSNFRNDDEGGENTYQDAMIWLFIIIKLDWIELTR